jgi:predicted RNase H-like HicB family nuclease
VEKETETKWTAIALGWWNCKAEGSTRDETLAKLKQVLAERLTHIELVQQTLPLPGQENPWLSVVGKYENDPQFEAVLEHIATYQRSLDAEMLDAEIQTENFAQDEARLD